MKYTAEKTFPSPYDFYDLDYEAAWEWVGVPFRTTGIKGNDGRIYYGDRNNDHFYFPIHLYNEWANYGKQVGLISVLDSVYVPSYKSWWFKLGSFSPDDLDIDLEFRGTETFCKSTRRHIVRYLLHNPNKWIDTDYREAFENINRHVDNVGDLY